MQKRNIIFLPVLQNDKKSQLEGKLKDVRFRLSAQRREVEQTNLTRETRIAEITLLQQQLQVRKSNGFCRNCSSCLYISRIFNKKNKTYLSTGLPAMVGEANSR